MADLFSTDMLADEVDFAVDIDRDELARVKDEYGITDTENAAALWVREARMHRDVALRIAQKLQGQRDYWRTVAQKGSASGGRRRGDPTVSTVVEQDNETDSKLSALIRHAEQSRAQDTPFDLFPVERRPAVVSAAATAAATATAMNAAESTSDGGKTPPIPAPDTDPQSTSSSPPSSAGSSVLFLASYYQQMALLTTRLLETMAVSWTHLVNWRMSVLVQPQSFIARVQL